MVGKISREARRELLVAIRERYRRASKNGKSRILDEVVALAQCHRKTAIRLLQESDTGSSVPVRVDRRLYNEAVREALTILWEASDRICGKRLKAIIPSLVDAMESRGHLKLDAFVRERLLSISPATIDRLLAPVRSRAGTRKKRRRATKPSKSVPVRTFADWNDLAPGYLEIDFVLHCGGVIAGTHVHSFVATDVCSGWTEAVPLLVREQSLVTEGIDLFRRQFPIPILGINSDNDSAFINDTLVSYCEREQIEFTRSRPYRKNDQAWIEQKNGAIIRRFVGYERFSGVVAAQVLAQLYQAMRLYVNFFQPSFKLLEKTRDGAKVKKSYLPPATPCDRLLSREGISESVKSSLRLQQSKLDPIELLHRIRTAQAALASLSSSAETSSTKNEKLEEFLEELPHVWKSGEARPTHRREPASARHWRTRTNPFALVWPEILVWLQKDPAATAKTLFERLQQNYPEQFKDGQLRTLQRRIREWRQTMARKLVFSGDQEGTAMPICPIETAQTSTTIPLCQHDSPLTSKMIGARITLREQC